MSATDQEKPNATSAKVKGIGSVGAAAELKKYPALHVVVKVRFLRVDSFTSYSKIIWRLIWLALSVPQKNPLLLETANIRSCLGMLDGVRTA